MDAPATKSLDGYHAVSLIDVLSIPTCAELVYQHLGSSDRAAARQTCVALRQLVGFLHGLEVQHLKRVFQHPHPTSNAGGLTCQSAQGNAARQQGCAEDTGHVSQGNAAGGTAHPDHKTSSQLLHFCNDSLTSRWTAGRVAGTGPKCYPGATTC
jgi:hypothetical protein